MEYGYLGKDTEDPRTDKVHITSSLCEDVFGGAAG